MTTTGPSVPTIYKLTIERYRGIKHLSWRPARSVNLILGGGDVGKTTILEAISLLLSPTNSATVLDSDYNLRGNEAEFNIEAVMALPSGGGINQLTKPSWPWYWNGFDEIVPVYDENSAPGEEVYVLRVRGTADQINWDYAVIERLDRALLRTELIPFNLGKAVIQRDATQHLPLLAGDVVTLLSQNDLRLPLERQTRLVNGTQRGTDRTVGFPGRAGGSSPGAGR